MSPSLIIAAMNVIAGADDSGVTSRKRPVKAQRSYNDDGRLMGKTCTAPTCDGEMKSLDSFTLSRSNSDGLHSECRSCSSKRARTWAATMDGFMTGLLNASCSRTTSRNKSRRARGLLLMEHTLTREQLNQKVTAQDGKCFLSGMPLIFEHHSDWMASLERLRNGIGYTDSNTALICCEFNTSIQWTPEKIVRLFGEGFDEPIIFKASEFNAARRGGRTFRSPACEAGWSFCTSCKEVKPRSAFEAGDVKHGCRACRKAKAETWSAAIGLLAANAKSHAKTCRNPKTYDLDKLFLVKLLETQQGLCAYSGKQITTSGAYKLSLERIDVFRGYERDNVCLVCVEFNSFDRSADVRSDTTKTGSSGWSKAKYERVKTLIRAKAVAG